MITHLFKTGSFLLAGNSRIVCFGLPFGNGEEILHTEFRFFDKSYFQGHFCRWHYLSSFYRSLVCFASSSICLFKCAINSLEARPHTFPSFKPMTKQNSVEQCNKYSQLVILRTIALNTHAPTAAQLKVKWYARSKCKELAIALAFTTANCAYTHAWPLQQFQHAFFVVVLFYFAHAAKRTWNAHSSSPHQKWYVQCKQTE